ADVDDALRVVRLRDDRHAATEPDVVTAGHDAVAPRKIEMSVRLAEHLEILLGWRRHEVGIDEDDVARLIDPHADFLEFLRFEPVKPDRIVSRAKIRRRLRL